MVIRITPAAIINRQLPFEYTITSRSTDVVVMAQPVQNINHSAFRSMFKREKLSGNNFNDWFRQLKLVLRVEKKMFVIDQPCPPAPAADSAANVMAEWNAIYDAYNEVACLMLGSMTPELHIQFENYSPYDMLRELKFMFEKHDGVERFYLIQIFHACKQEEGKPVAAYVLQMKGYVDQLKRLGYMLPQDLIVGLILNSLTKDFVEFGLPKKDETPQVMTIKGGKIQTAKKKSLKAKGKGKANGKGKDKQVYIPKPKNPKPSAKEHPAKDDTCHTTRSKLALPVLQGFREARKLKQGALYLYVGNGVRSQVEAIESYDLVFPNGLVIFLDTCHYASSITRGVVSVHPLVENGFVLCFTDFGISVSKNNVHYFNAIPSNGIYEIDMHDLVPNKRIEKLQQEGLLKSTNDESFDQYISCLSGKMTRKSFPRRLERATNLLGIIHTDVCSPLRHVARQCASYFITFTDDYSLYGYVYLLKHKHELTPPYTPQHNGVSKRRNRTLLDMVRSMMNLTTLPLSFWDYALESATRILNMVPTKKTTVKNILKYLRNTKDMFLVYGGNPEAELRVDCYCDARFEIDRDDTKSQTGYVFILNGGAVDWKSSKQSTTAMSATEAEYIATSEAAIEAVWIMKFISGLGIVPTINEPIKMFCDNSAALHFSNEPGVQKGARHYHRRYHYVRESIELGEIKFLKVHTDDNLADPFMKTLRKGKLTQHARSMGLRLASSFM
ncbi:retrotransposon protein, putative, ty1-copia subclass [Tanacetum coccineum]|uniref:Retrotransposon protein, putative, ty1-copia subclass n=1 Tax=Tanacetum coccineum TaxID=301880 RepID=A0ABQ5H4S1_9ASTR